MTFFWCKFGFGKFFGVSSWSNHWAGCYWSSYKIHFFLHVTIQSRNGWWWLYRRRCFKMMIFLIFGQLMSHLPIKPFHLSNLFQMLNDCRMVDAEFFGKFSCSCKRISFDDCSQLVVVNFGWPATTLLIFKSLISFATLLNCHCTFISSSWAKCIIAGFMQHLCCFMTPSELKSENCLHLLFV